jgi:4-hydroxyphenylacetate 3-monooxygenase
MALTGAEYLASLRDGRAVYVRGERVSSVPDHPAFAQAARFVAGLYDSLHDTESPDHKALTFVTERGALSHRSFRIARTRRHLEERAEAMRSWSRRHFGFMGRTPDYKSGLAISLGAWPEFFEPYGANARSWYERLADDVLFMNHVGVNPMVDRSKRPHELPDVNVRVVKERDDGFVVRGAKMVGTAAVFTHCNLVFSFSPLPLTEADSEHALVFIVPTGAEGLKLLSRTSYELAARDRSPFDYPLSSRFDENDSTLIFDDVFIPWENTLVYRDSEKANRFFPMAQVTQNLMLHGGVRFATKLRFLAGLLIKIAQQNGTIGLRGVRVRVGEVIAWHQAFEALVRDACSHPDPGPNGTVAPSHRSIFALRALAPMVYPQVRQLIEEVGGGGFIQLPSGAEDLRSAELRPFIDQYYRGTGVEAEDRIKLWKLAWDAIGSEFGARQELFERHYAGNVDNVRLDNLFLAEHNGDLEQYEGFVQQCLDGYDLSGWTP